MAQRPATGPGVSRSPSCIPAAQPRQLHAAATCVSTTSTLGIPDRCEGCRTGRPSCRTAPKTATSVPSGTMQPEAAGAQEASGLRTFRETLRGCPAEVDGAHRRRRRPCAWLYTTKDPDKIVIRAALLLRQPVRQGRPRWKRFISGLGTVTDGLILRITTSRWPSSSTTTCVARRSASGTSRPGRSSWSRSGVPDALADRGVVGIVVGRSDPREPPVLQVDPGAATLGAPDRGAPKT